jgi:flagellar motor switch/type III secretory pathway protein FliN
MAQVESRQNMAMALGSGAAAGKAALAAKSVGVEQERERERELERNEDARWKPVLGLPCEMIVDLPLPGVKISDLLKLRAGSVINAHWRVGRDVPLQLNGLLIGWSEFEVVGNNLAVRLTELA